MPTLEETVQLLEQAEHHDAIEICLADAKLDDVKIGEVLCPAINHSNCEVKGSLSLNDNPELTDEGVIRLCSSLEKIKCALVECVTDSFTVMSVKGTSLHDDGVADILMAFREKKLPLLELHLGELGIQGVEYLISYLSSDLAKEHLTVLCVEGIIAVENLGTHKKFQLGQREGEEGDEDEETQKAEARRNKWESAIRTKLEYTEEDITDEMEVIDKPASKGGATLAAKLRLEELLRKLQDALEKSKKILVMDVRCDDFPWIRTATKLIAAEHKIRAERATGHLSAQKRSSHLKEVELNDRRYLEAHVVPALAKAVRLCEEELLSAPMSNQRPAGAHQQLAFISSVMKGQV
ncbi:hypothetical protein FOL47_008131 [Perkinsus chesapeaki]|uniref:Uncharacterized protein n=1 Tax=Perkinsus chesapeaki TaxID=330153 RepID=A0A7J6LG02_PERCH|nr:hypothetical protein FOL47_008131 [Perkinsus chesapeaki]